jgi:hypothetical protein
MGNKLLPPGRRTQGEQCPIADGCAGDPNETITLSRLGGNPFTPWLRPAFHKNPSGGRQKNPTLSVARRHFPSGHGRDKNGGFSLQITKQDGRKFFLNPFLERFKMAAEISRRFRALRSALVGVGPTMPFGANRSCAKMLRFDSFSLRCFIEANRTIGAHAELGYPFSN